MIAVAEQLQSAAASVPGRVRLWLARQPPARKEHFPAVAFILAINLVCFAPVLFGRTYSMVGAHMYAQYPWAGMVTADPAVGGRGYPQTDQAETFYPLSVYSTAAVRHGELPIWLPYTFGGLPVMELGMSGLLYPPRLLLALVLSPIRQHDMLLFTHLLLAGLGMYALLRCWNASRLGALFGAIVWGFNGHNAFWLIFEHAPIAAAWLPWMMLAATLAVQRRSLPWAVATGVTSSMFVFSGYLHYVYLGGLMLAGWYGATTIWTAWGLARERKYRLALFYLSLPVLSFIIAAILSASLWLPMFQVLAEAHRQPSSLLNQLNEGSSWLALLKGLVLPESAAGPAGRPPDFQSLGFAGLTALTLAVAAPFFRRSAPVLFGSIVGLFSLWIVRGVDPLFVLLRKFLPFFNTFHAPEGYFLFCFAVATLAAFGLSAVSNRQRAARAPLRLYATIGIMLLLSEALLFLDFIGVIRLKEVLYGLQEGFYLDYLLVLIFILSPLTARWVRRVIREKNLDWNLKSFWPALGGLLVVMVALKLVAFIWLTNPMQPERREWLYPETPLVTALKVLQKDRRILPLRKHLPSEAWSPPVLFSTVPAVFGLRSGSGYESLLPNYTASLWRTVENGGVPRNDVLAVGYRFNLNHDRVPIKLLEKVSVGLLVTPPNTEPLDTAGNNLARDGTLTLVYGGTDGWIYEDARAVPRAFIVPRAVIVADEPSALRLLASKEFDPRNEVIVSEPESRALAGALPGADVTLALERQASITREGINEVEVHAVSSQPAWLVLNDSWAAGWKAFVDGEEQRVARVNYAFRGIIIPAGSHRVVFRYRPRLLLVGLSMSAGAFVLVGCFWLYMGLRRATRLRSRRLTPSVSL